MSNEQKFPQKELMFQYSSVHDVILVTVFIHSLKANIITGTEQLFKKVAMLHKEAIL